MPRFAPRAQVDCTHDDAEEVGRNESYLGRFESDDAHDDAIDAGQRPAFPIPPPHQNGGRDGQYAR
jgi:hypothetical protein